LSWKRKILAVVFPPFAVVDKGCGTYLIAFILTCLGWLPGIIYAFVVLKLEQRNKNNSTGNHASKMQSRTTAKSNASSGTSQQSPFNRPRRMSSNNNQSSGWQGW
jgi:uncharacterized membrane protein YqaE (UPF0057 family)